jgi:hypothetical protein
MEIEKLMEHECFFVCNATIYGTTDEHVVLGLGN